MRIEGSALQKTASQRALNRKWRYTNAH